MPMRLGRATGRAAGDRAEDAPPRPFRSLEDAAQYAEAHDVGETGPPGELPAPQGGSVTLHLSAALLQQLRREAIRRGTGDLNVTATALLEDALRAVAHDTQGRGARAGRQ